MSAETTTPTHPNNARLVDAKLDWRASIRRASLRHRDALIGTVFDDAAPEDE